VSPKPMLERDRLAREFGLKQALNVQALVALWALFELAEGRPPANVDELAEAVGRSRATVYRWMQAFRLAYPGQDPQQVVDLARQQLATRRPTAAAIGALPVGWAS
jgi:hypothetical protein